MTRFASQFKKAAAPNLVRQFGETVTYRPLGGTARTIEAIVEREQQREFAGDSEVLLPVWVITIRNSATAGIASHELNLGGDEIDLPPRDGETAVTKTITGLAEADPATLTVECR